MGRFLASTDEVIENTVAVRLPEWDRILRINYWPVDADERRFVMEHGSADLMIMNPPYTRPTNHKVARRMSAVLKEIYGRMPDPGG